MTYIIKVYYRDAKMNSYVSDSINNFVDYALSHPILEVVIMNAYHDWLNDVFDTVEICGLTYESSHALKHVDEIAYGEIFNTYLESVITDMTDEMEREDITEMISGEFRIVIEVDTEE